LPSGACTVMDGLADIINNWLRGKRRSATAQFSGGWNGEERRKFASFGS
jgi:hypothetical protein